MVRRTLIGATVAAYSYEHQCKFALRGGADATSAVLWVDGLLVLATVGLLQVRQHATLRVWFVSAGHRRVAGGEHRRRGRSVLGIERM